MLKISTALFVSIPISSSLQAFPYPKVKKIGHRGGPCFRVLIRIYTYIYLFNISNLHLPMHTPGKTCEHCNTPWMQLHSCLLALYSILCDYASKSVSLRIAPILPYPKVQKIGHQRQPNLQVLIKRQIKFASWRLAICNRSVLTYAHS